MTATVRETGELHQPIVRMSAVSKSYGAVPGIRDLNLEIRPGETVALLGPNGAGKSTTVNLMLGLRRPDRGDVRVAGHPPTWYRARSASGVVLQNSGLPGNLRVRELVSLFRAYYPTPLGAEEAMAKAGVTELRDRHFGELSGGQQQRVYIALSLCARPRLLVLDEPSVGLDVGTRRQLWELLATMAAEGCAVVLATHNLDEAEALADRVVLVVGSRVIFDGPPAAIKSMFTLRHVRASMSAPPDLAGLPDRGVEEVSYRDGTLLATTNRPAVLMRVLLAQSAEVTDLEIRGVTFEEAVTTVLRDRAACQDDGGPTVPADASSPGLVEPAPGDDVRRSDARRTVELRAWLRMTAAQTRAEFLKLWRDTLFVVVTCLMPTIFFAFFGTSYTSAGDGALYGLASLSAYGAIGVGLFGFGVGIAAERGMRWDQLIRATPMRISAYVAARVVPAALFTLLTLGLLAGYAVTVAGVRVSLWTWLQLAGGLTVGNVVFIALGLAIGYNLPPRAAMPAATVIYLPLSVASGLLVPPSELAGHVQTAAEFLPAWHYALIGWDAVDAGPGFGPLSAVVLTAYTAGFLALAAVGYRREVKARYL